jgi:SHS2 domain-containing protein
MTYTFLEHTADVKFQAESENLEGAFIESAYAMKETICGEINVLDLEKKEIELKGTDLENLLYKFLEEFLVLLDSEGFLLSKIEEIKINKENFSLNAKISGDKAEHYRFTNDVKAVTYNEMSVKQTDKGWQTKVVLDV